MASFEALIVQSSFEHVKLRSSWTITVPSQNPNLSLTTLSSSHFLRQPLQSPSALSSPSDRSRNIGSSVPSGGHRNGHSDWQRLLALSNLPRGE